MGNFCTFVMRVGARLPGIKAVVIMMSTSFACFANNSISAAINSGVISLAYPPTLRKMVKIELFLEKFQGKSSPFFQFEAFHLQEFRTHRLSLLLNGGAGVETANNRTHIFSSSNRRQTSYTTTNNQHLCWLGLSCSSDLSSEEATEMTGSLDYSFVSRNVRHRAESIIALRSRNTRNTFHSKYIHFFLCEEIHQCLILRRIDKTEKS